MTISTTVLRVAPGVLRVTPGDHATLRKKHPCGGFDWTVTRVGSDIGLRCDGCGRRVMLGREDFERRLKRLVPEASDSTSVRKDGAC